jgi:hypothetical protein
MPGPLLFSTNPWFSLNVAERYRGGLHFAWCSEEFEAVRPAAGGTLAIPASSDPCTIYQHLHKAVIEEDAHDDRIRSYKRKFKALASDWYDRGDITEAQRDEIKAICNRHSWLTWRPKLLVIPRANVESRLEEVPVRLRAGVGPEYIIKDLAAHEFTYITLPRLGEVR